MLQALLQTALETLQAGRPAMLVAVVRATGSTPRETGALMLAGPDGLLAGTVGGGLLEHRCLEIAAAQPHVPHRETFVLDNRQAGSLGMVCGGASEMLFTPLSDPAPLEQALAALRGHADAWLCLPLDGSAPFAARDCALPARPAVVTHAGRAVLAVRLADAGRVFLLGGGHVSCALADLLYRLDFRTLVLDDRPAFCSPAASARRAHAHRLLYRAGRDAHRRARAHADDAFCIMTRGHDGDAAAVRFALGTPASYIGLMGSRRKRETLFQQLAREGVPDARRRIVTPVGLAIGAQTPYEIAVSVAAQLIAWRAGR